VFCLRGRGGALGIREKETPRAGASLSNKIVALLGQSKKPINIFL
jgi:hypothetical protein